MRFTPFLALACVSAAAQAHVPTLPPQAAIDHAANGGIRDWHAVDAKGLYLRDRTNRWYYAAFRHVCPGILTDARIAFDTHGDHRFDRLSNVVTSTETCAVESLVESPAPAAKGGRVSHAHH
jgi:hypothetical protein